MAFVANNRATTRRQLARLTELLEKAEVEDESPVVDYEPMLYQLASVPPSRTSAMPTKHAGFTLKRATAPKMLPVDVIQRFADGRYEKDVQKEPWMSEVGWMLIMDDLCDSSYSNRPRPSKDPNWRSGDSMSMSGPLELFADEWNNFKKILNKPASTLLRATTALDDTGTRSYPKGCDERNNRLLGKPKTFNYAELQERMYSYPGMSLGGVNSAKFFANLGLEDPFTGGFDSLITGRFLFEKPGDKIDWQPGCYNGPGKPCTKRKQRPFTWKKQKMEKPEF